MAGGKYAPLSVPREETEAPKFSEPGGREWMGHRNGSCVWARLHSRITLGPAAPPNSLYADGPLLRHTVYPKQSDHTITLYATHGCYSRRQVGLQHKGPEAP